MSITFALQRVRRDIGIKRCVVLDGNVGDVFLSKGKVRTLDQTIQEMLQELQYDTVVFWNPVTGMEQVAGVPIDLVEEVTLEGEDYEDYEDYEEYGNVVGSGDEGNPTSEEGDRRQPPREGNLRPSNSPFASKTPAPQVKQLSDFCAVIHKQLQHKGKRVAFVINWSDYLFGGEQSLSAEEREQLATLAKSIRSGNTSLFFGDKAGVNDSVLLFVAQKRSQLPLSLYQGNVEASCVTLPRPDRLEREDLLRQLDPSFLIDMKGKETLLTCEKRNQYIDMLDEFSNREIIQMAKLSVKWVSQGEKPLTFEKLYYMFRYGEKDNPWEKLDYHAVSQLKETLSKRVVGQASAIARVYDVVVKAYMGMSGIHKQSSLTMPKGVLFFVGPTGVGKTELSKALAQFLFGDEQACIRFDMSEYAQENSDQKLIGAPPGFVGYEEGGQLTNALRDKPFSLILFDEIEKAAKPNPRILDIFLQILEDGRLTDSKGDTVHFSESVIVFTSNLGASKVESSGTPEEVSASFLSIVKEYFNNELGRPELLGRIGTKNIIPFQFIQDATFTKEIAQSKLQPIVESIQEQYKLTLQFDNEEEFVDFVLKEVDCTKGGRDILHALSDILLDQLAHFLFENKEEAHEMRGGSLFVSVEEKKGKLKFRFA